MSAMARRSRAAKPEEDMPVPFRKGTRLRGDRHGRASAGGRWRHFRAGRAIGAAPSHRFLWIRAAGRAARFEAAPVLLPPERGVAIAWRNASTST